MGSGELTLFATFSLNGITSYPFVADKNYDLMYVFISKSSPGTIINQTPTIGGVNVKLLNSRTQTRTIYNIGFGNAAFVYEIRNILKGTSITINSGAIAQYTLLNVTVLVA